MAISKDKHDLYKDEYNKSYMAADYSIKRMDIVLISVSTAGIFLNSQVIQWVFENEVKTNCGFSYIAIMFFGLCIMTNLLGQYMSFLAHNHFTKFYREQLTKIADITMPKYTGTLNKNSGDIIDLCNLFGLIFIYLAMLFSFFGIII